MGVTTVSDREEDKTTGAPCKSFNPVVLVHVLREKNYYRASEYVQSLFTKIQLHKKFNRLNSIIPWRKDCRKACTRHPSPESAQRRRKLSPLP